ncbi:ionotropic receptor 68b [Haematobia irritans]|uniref:ionotropic receptor 68b n=1 Tax=Haematobia irritans TaxID=7368 RepID=UPI003F5043F8
MIAPDMMVYEPSLKYLTSAVINQNSDMEHLEQIIASLALVAVIIQGTFSHQIHRREEMGDANFEESKEFSLKICDVAQKREAQINIFYTTPLEMRSSVKLNWPLLHQCLFELPFWVRSLDFYETEPERTSGSLNLFLVTSSQSAQRILDFINPHQRWKQGHRYLFIWLLPQLDVGNLRDFFLVLWSKNILHALVAWDSEHLYTFEPFSLEGFRLRTIGKHENYYYDKLRNFHRFQVSITMFTDPVRASPLPNSTTQGYRRIDGRIASALVEELNATARYITPADNETYGSLRNGTFSGALKDIHSGLAHIGFNLRYTLDHVKEHIEELYPYQRRFLYLVVPAAKMRPGYMIFVRAFSNSLWRLMILTFSVALLAFIILQHVVQHIPYGCKTSHKSWHELMEILYKTQLGGPVNTFSNINSLRQFLIAWILFSYVLTTMYFAKLESNFVQPTYEPDMDSLEELSHLHIPIYGYDIVFDAIKVTLHPRYYELINGLGVRIPTNSHADKFAFEVTQKNANVALILHDEIAKELLAHTFDETTKRPSYHIVREYLRTLTISYVVTKGSPFIHKFQQVVSAFHEFGFMRHWTQVESHNTEAHKSQEFFEEYEDELDLNDDEDSASGLDAGPSTESLSMKKVVLNLDILQGAFYLWLVGILISFIGFAMEWLYWWCNRNTMGKIILNGIHYLDFC